MKSIKTSALVLLSLLACVFALSACTDHDPVSPNQPAAALAVAAKTNADSLTKGGITLIRGHYLFRLEWTDDSIGKDSARGVTGLVLQDWPSELSISYGHQSQITFPRTHFTRQVGTSYTHYTARVVKVDNNNKWYDAVEFANLRFDDIQPTVKAGEGMLRASWSAKQFSGTPFQVQYRKPGESWPAARGADWGETTQYEFTFASGINHSTTYQVRIRDKRGSEFEPWTQPVTVTTLGPIPAGADPSASGSSGQPEWKAPPDEPAVIYVYAPKAELTAWYGSVDWQIDDIRYWVRVYLPDASYQPWAHETSASGLLNPQYPIELSSRNLVTGTEYVIRWEFRTVDDTSNILRVTTRATAR